MGIFDDNDDKTEAATPKKLADSRSKGNVAMSQELSMASLLIGAVLTLELTGPWILSALQRGLEHGLRVRRPTESGVGWAVQEFRSAALRVAPTLVPFMVGLLVFGLAVGFAQAGIKFTWVKLAPDINRLNPAAGLKKLVSLRGPMRAGLAVLKLVLLGTILWWQLGKDLNLLLSLPELPFAIAAPRVGKLLLQILWWIAVPIAALAILDLLYQRWQHARDQRMSKQEIKDETKQTEGDPEIKARIKRAQRELAKRRMMAEVPLADVIVTNPTHFAVALKYDRGRMTAPAVTAKGTDRVALRIRELARENGVPVMEDPPLARALHRGVRLGDEIPPKFYQAVATVLSHVMRMKRESA